MRCLNNDRFRSFLTETSPSDIKAASVFNFDFYEQDKDYGGLAGGCQSNPNSGSNRSHMILASP
jgi:hypothetical protein